MSRVDFAELPDSARVWVFASDRALSDEERDRLLSSVDQFLDEWRAHGQPLSAARDWREARFLAVGVDQRQAHASGCSIDGLYRSLSEMERSLETSLLAGGRVFYRDAEGAIRVCDRDEFAKLAERGEARGDTPVFDITVTTAGDWRTRFESVAARTWHASLLSAESDALGG